MYSRQSNQPFDQFMKFQQQQWEQFQQFYHMQKETHAPSNHGRFERVAHFPRQAIEAQPEPIHFERPAIKYSQAVPQARRPVNNVNHGRYFMEEADFEEEKFSEVEDIFSILLNALGPQNVKAAAKELPKQHKKVQTQNPIFQFTIPELPVRNNAAHSQSKAPTAEKPGPNRRVNVPEAKAAQPAKPGCFRVNIPANAAPVRKGETNTAPARRCTANVAPASKPSCFRVNIPANAAGASKPGCLRVNIPANAVPERKSVNIPVRPSEQVKKPVENNENGLKEFQKIREEFNELVSELRTADDSKIKFYENKLMKMLLQIDETACSPQVRPLRKLLVTKINTCLDFLQEKLNPKPVVDANADFATSESIPASQSSESPAETGTQSDSIESITSSTSSETSSAVSTEAAETIQNSTSTVTNATANSTESVAAESEANATEYSSQTELASSTANSALNTSLQSSASENSEASPEVSEKSNIEPSEQAVTPGNDSTPSGDN